MKYKGIIFDLDGTLMNSIEDLAESMNIVLNENGFPEHQIDRYEELIGNGIKNLVKKALPSEEFEKDEYLSYFNRMFDIYGNNCTNKTYAYSGIHEMLDKLASTKVKMAILSNKADHLTKKVVKTLLPDYNFISVSGLTDEGSRKPDPNKALKICKLMELLPEEVVFIGDSGVDMQTAKNAGMDSIGVSWGFRSVEELKETGAKYIIHHPSKLLDFMD